MLTNSCLVRNVQDTLPTMGILKDERLTCRICLESINRDGLQLGCCCKGDLALAHKNCAIKWFSIRRNGLCEVCSDKAKNLDSLIVLSDFSSNRWDAEDVFYDVDYNGSWRDLAALFLNGALTSFWQWLRDLSEFP
ncbi:hypothetical protein O6H91_19G062000 [Diphasiastrum complanatum]|uniref:Uncharacterized protein n=1 Tax=Diphasiastrum complanatum TaxID=34168 RepID=A0ACC2AVQ9_DIPCM|nr:hypothetical protein O6H91_19G062000 [Diphasiastrum complanatum]